MEENTSRYVSAIITARRENETSSYDAKTPTSDRVCLPRLLQRCGGKMQHRRSTFAKKERGRLQTKRLEPLDNKNKKFRTEKTHWPNSPTYPSRRIHPFARLHNSNVQSKLPSIKHVKRPKNCITPSFSSRLSQENASPWQPEHFVIDHLCSRAASKQP